MKDKRFLRYISLIFLFFVLTFSNASANLFLDNYSVPVKFKVTSFQADVADRYIGFLMQDKFKKLWYIGSSDGGGSFTSELKVTDAAVKTYALSLNNSLSVLIWVNDEQKKIKYILLNNRKQIILYKGTVYKYVCETIYNIRALFDFENDEISIVFIEQYKHHSNLKFIKFSTFGDVLENKVLFSKGYSFLPRIKKNKNTYLLVWSSLIGDSEEIFYSFSEDTGKNWMDPKQLTSNNFNDRISGLSVGKNGFYLVWQDDRLGNWNISYEEFRNKNWENFSRVTSGLIYHWLPRIGTYHDKIFSMWIDKSQGNAAIFYKSKNHNKNTWSSPKRVNDNTVNVNSYEVATSEKFILLAYLKGQQLYFSKLYSDMGAISIKKQKIENNGYKLTWSVSKNDIFQYVIRFSCMNMPHNNAFVPVLNKKENSFYIYLKNKNLLNNFSFHIRYLDDIGGKSKWFSTPIIVNGQKKKKDIIDWKNIDNRQIYYNIMKNKLYVPIKYHKGMTRKKILNRLYFYVINKLNQENIGEKNKFIQVFDIINGNINFNRLIDGDKIFLPILWGNIQFVSLIKKNIKSTLKKIEDIYDLKNKGYIYYILSGDLGSIKKYDKAKKNDILVVIIPY